MKKDIQKTQKKSSSNHNKNQSLKLASDKPVRKDTDSNGFEISNGFC